MVSRRGFLGAGVAFVGCSMLAPHAHAQAARRTVTLRGKKMKVIDIHAHCAIPEAMATAASTAIQATLSHSSRKARRISLCRRGSTSTN